MVTALLVIGILVLLIVVHELGHFLAAKLFGVSVEEFGVGYPPRALTFGTWGGTEYTLNWIPFGGFVRLFGDVGEGEYGKGSLVGKNRGIQAAILLAGVFMNAVAAWALFTGALYIGIPRPVEHPLPNVPASLLVSEILPDSPAAAAGLLTGDRIVRIAAEDGETLQEYTPAGVVEFVRARGGEPLDFTYVRGDETSTVVVTPAHAINPLEVSQPAIGIALVLVTNEPLPLLEAAQSAFVSTINAFQAIAAGIVQIAQDAIHGAPALESIVGPIGLVDVVGAAAENGAGEVLALAAFISVNLVIINLLPIPALDGGRLFVLGIEAVVRRSAPKLAVNLLNVLGIALIVFLMITVTWNDIARLIA